MHKLWARLSQLLFPPTCLVCQQPGSYLCAACLVQDKFPPAVLRCVRCNRPAIAGRTHNRCRTARTITGVWASSAKTPALLKLAKQLKYRNSYQLASTLVKIMLLRPLPVIDQADCLVPVPLHPRRQKERGFNQAQLLAQQLSAHYHLPVINHWVKRIHHGKHQADIKHRPERIKNIARGFAATSSLPDLSGKKIVLVDDLTTTGATLQQTAAVLLARKPDWVWGWAIAK